jgi:ligand-binding SRPBCC domain-containing protein
MKTYKLETQLWLPAARDRLFKFFAEPSNLERITPSWLHFEMTTPPTTVIGPGTLLDYRLRLRGIPVRWQSEIAVWEPPSRFIDRQTKGPYSLWVHEHTFTERDSGTVIGDSVEYAVPGGTIVQRLLVAPELERIFRYRHKVLEELFNAKNYEQQSTSGGTC